MIKIKVTSQLESVDNVSKLFNPDLYLRPVAIEIIPIMAERIHERGEDSNGAQIGTYSKKYMEVRKEFGRGSDTKVIASLTRQLENDYAVNGTSSGWAIGFNNALSVEKRNTVERRFRKEIWKFTPEEREKAKEKINREVQKIINGN